MKRLIIMVLSKTKIGAWVKDAQKLLDGKKQILAGLGTALPASLLIISNFVAAENGIEYLMNIAQAPEFAAAGLGWGLVFNALKGEKIREKQAETDCEIKKLEKLEREVKDLLQKGKPNA